MTSPLAVVKNGNEGRRGVAVAHQLEAGRPLLSMGNDVPAGPARIHHASAMASYGQKGSEPNAPSCRREIGMG